MLETGDSLHDEQEDEGLSGSGWQRRRARGATEKRPRVEIGGLNFPRTPEGTAARAAHAREREREEDAQKQGQERERLAQAQVVQERARAAERYRTSRVPDAFQFQIERSADARGLDLRLLDRDGTPMTRFDKDDAGIVTERPVLLSDYVPELKNTPIADETAPHPWHLITRAVEESYRVKLEAAKKKFEAAKAKLLKLHEPEERAEGYEKAEEQYRESVEHIFHEREHRIAEILKEVGKEQNIDLASSVGGTEALLKAREENNKKWLKEYLIFPEHQEEKKWHSVVTNLPGEFVHGVRVEQALIEKKSGRFVAIRKAAQWVKPAITTPLSMGAVATGSILILLGKLAGTLLEKPWATVKEYVNEFTFGQAFKDDGHGAAPKKKSGGGGGGHH